MTLSWVSCWPEEQLWNDAAADAAADAVEVAFDDDDVQQQQQQPQ